MEPKDRMVPERFYAIALALLFVLTLPIVTPTLRGDGIGYYAYVASAIIDRDFMFENEYRRSNPGVCAYYFDEEGEPRESLRTPTGHLSNFYSVGPGLLWAPFFAVAHAGTSIRNAISSDGQVPLDGYSLPYLLACALGTALMGFGGLFLGFLVARSVASPWAAFWGMLGIWFASSIPVYMYFLPFLAHAHTALVDGAFVWYWWRSYREPSAAAPTMRTTRQWLLLGVLAGLMFTTYYIGALFWIFIALDGLAMLWAWQRDGDPWSERFARIGRTALPLAGGVLLGMLPHLVIKQIIYGAPVSMGYEIPWHWHAPNLFNVLLSSRHGLWLWTPIVLFSCLGFVPLTRRHPALGARAALTFLACWYLMGSKYTWEGGSAFGNRYFLILTPLFVIGLATFFQALVEGLASLRPRVVRMAVAACVSLLVVWNLGFIFQWGVNLVPNRGGISFSQMATNQVTVVPRRVVELMGPFLFDRRSFVEEIEREDEREVPEVVRSNHCQR